MERSVTVTKTAYLPGAWGARAVVVLGLGKTGGANGGLSTGGLAGGLFGASLGGTLSQPPHLGARSLASRDGLQRPAGSCCGSGLALDVDGGALFTVGGRCGGYADMAM